MRSCYGPDAQPMHAKPAFSWTLACIGSSNESGSELLVYKAASLKVLRLISTNIKEDFFLD